MVAEPTLPLGEVVLLDVLALDGVLPTLAEGLVLSLLTTLSLALLSTLAVAFLLPPLLFTLLFWYL